MKQLFRPLILVPLFLYAAKGAGAQPELPVFGFARTPLTDKQQNLITTVKETDRANLLPLTAGKELRIRANTTSELFLWVRNPSENKKTYIVELTAAKGTINIRSKAITIPGETWSLVTLPKAAQPAPPAGTVAITPSAAAPATPQPPGLQLLPGDEIRLNLLDEQGEKVLDERGNPYVGTFKVFIPAPGDYVEPTGSAIGFPGTQITAVSITVKQRATDPERRTPSDAYPGSGPIQLQFPPQEARKGAVIREGFYRRNLNFEAFPQKGTEPSVDLAGKIEGALPGLIVHVGVDGIDRAFKYVLGTPSSKDSIKLIPDRAPAIRVTLANPNQPAITKPAGTFPIHIQVDNPLAGDKLEVRLRPAGSSEQLTERLVLDQSRDERAWLETVGPQGGLLFTTQSKDWVKALDLANLQGRIEVAVTLIGIDGKPRATSNSLSLMVDGTPPELVEFVPMANPLQVEKGKTLRIAARGVDRESGLSKAVFFLARDLDEGQMPADAIKASGHRIAMIPRADYIEEWWAADIKIPDDFRGNGVMGVTFTNQAGISSPLPEVQRIEITDAVPKIPLGTIEGRVVYADRPQPNVSVKLWDSEGKEKGSATTNDKGLFNIKNVPPGNYTLSAQRPDSSTGVSGATSVQVEAEKTVKTTVTLNKNRK